MARVARVVRHSTAVLAFWVGVGMAAVPFPGDIRRQDIDTGPTRHAVWLDLEGDGDADLALADPRRVVRVLRDDGGSFVELGGMPSLFGGGHRLAAGDLDGDGAPDLVACSRRAKRRRGAGGCTILLNRIRASRAEPFEVMTLDPAVAPAAPRLFPLLADPDADGDLDVLLFPQKSKARPVLLRNDSDGAALTFATGDATGLSAATRVLDIAIVDQEGRGTTLWVSRRSEPALVLEIDPATGLHHDVAAARGLSPRSTRGGLVAAADVDGDGLRDVVAVAAGQRTRMFRRNDDETFTEQRLDSVSSKGAAAVVLDDFDRDGRRDLLVVRKRGRTQLFRNTFGAPSLVTDVSRAAGIGGRGVAAGTFHRSGECDDAVDLVLATGGRARSRVHRFPDDSASRTTPPDRPPAARGCVRGTEGDDELEGHRVASVLTGGGGDDRLIARAGVTVMTGGPGRDEFEARGGFAIIRLPRGDIAPGERIHCGLADAIWVDTTLSLAQLQAAGVEFDHCFEDGGCAEPDDDLDIGCHGGDSRLRVTNTGQSSPYVLMKMGLELGFAAVYGRGFGTCANSSDCYAIGLDVCRDAFGNLPSPPAGGKCYPSDFDGLEGPVAEWCHDPFWARARYEQVRTMNDAEGRRLVIPVVVWLIRSEAATDGGGCTVDGQDGPASIAAWHDSLTTGMGSTMALFATWGIGFDYAFRRLEVPPDSPFVVDPEDDSCRVQLAYTPGSDDANASRTIKELLLAYPNAYRPGQVNVYLSDVPPAGQSSGSGVSWSDPAKFIVLYGTAGALAHEIGHEIGLPHPYSSNLSASGTEPEEAESRDSWTRRPFPDPTTNRLALCNGDAFCNAVDAPPGACRKGPGAIFGFCQNLKKDCAENGDGICDTPWDATPCFQGIGPRLLDACGVDDDCHATSTFRGTSYLTECVSGRCRRVDCASNADCGGDSWCAGSYCVNHKDGFEACCDLHTDRRAGFVHNACWERRPNGAVVPVPGVGDSTTWPLQQNVMGYHKPRGLPKTLTFGQRDRVVCGLSYGARYGQLSRLPRPDGEPCTLRPGGNASTYGPIGVNRTVPHGACASGVCQVTNLGNGETSALCVSSSCSDGLVGADETSRDCGGECGTACPTTRPSDQPPATSACLAASDCVSNVCAEGVCQPTCSDGSRGGAELATDAGGVGFTLGCAGRLQGQTCRFPQDCAGVALFCEGTGECVLDSDCAVNDGAAPCALDADCPGGDCRVLRAACQLQSCVSDAQCPFQLGCDPLSSRCRCTSDAQCSILPGDSCQVFESVCEDECVDGRCLGICAAGIGG